MSNYIWPKITADTSLEEIKEIHRRIWDYVVEHGEKPDTPYKSNCALCEYSKRKFFKESLDGLCAACPAIWSITCVDGGTFACIEDGSCYSKWSDALEPVERKEYAKEVRDVPFKDS